MPQTPATKASGIPLCLWLGARWGCTARGRQINPTCWGKRLRIMCIISWCTLELDAPKVDILVPLARECGTADGSEDADRSVELFGGVITVSRIRSIDTTTDAGRGPASSRGERRKQRGDGDRVEGKDRGGIADSVVSGGVKL
ncbi:hypothetical protein M405DRAFT_840844 [Rhizopogon salebrosus TDB-379]|nr:hypothetical protein M405DRAFT_840844 [Rhizopogon salebrosus TDB-379]